MLIRQQQRIDTPTTIKLSDLEIRPSESTRLLGITIDENSVWNKYIENLTNKLNSTAYSIRTIWKYMSESAERFTSQSLRFL